MTARKTKTYDAHNSARFYSGEGNEKRLCYDLLAKEVMADISILTAEDNSEMFYYDDAAGIYRRGAKNKIKVIAKVLTEQKITTHQTRELLFQIETKTYIDRDKFDKEKHLIVLKNCVYDLKTNKTQPHTDGIKATSCIPIEYNPDADCPAVKKFMGEILDERGVKTVQQLFGYCLWRDYPIQRAVMLVGDGSNGKSTLINLLKAFLGKENCVSKELQNLDTSKNRFATAPLYGKLANLAADISDRAMLATGTFKALTGGDSIPAERKFKESFEFVNYSKQIYSANRLPAVKDKTDAFFRRWVLLFFDHKFEGENDDKNMLSKLTTPEEISGAFNWAIEGLKELLAAGDFTSAIPTDELREKYNALSNSLGAFVADCVEPQAGNSISKSDLYSAYSEYCRKNNLPILLKEKVGRDLQQHIEAGEGKKGSDRAWTGIRLKEGKQKEIGEF
ncbi:MAG: phage/plasmid primase, P4 family [Candidatus Diapherotrites archaeon]